MSASPHVGVYLFAFAVYHDSVLVDACMIGLKLGKEVLPVIEALVEIL
jgi:hypothetical protein